MSMQQLVIRIEAWDEDTNAFVGYFRPIAEKYKVYVTTEWILENYKKYRVGNIKIQGDKVTLNEMIETSKSLIDCSTSIPYIILRGKDSKLRSKKLIEFELKLERLKIS